MGRARGMDINFHSPFQNLLASSCITEYIRSLQNTQLKTIVYLRLTSVFICNTIFEKLSKTHETKLAPVLTLHCFDIAPPHRGGKMLKEATMCSCLYSANSPKLK